MGKKDFPPLLAEKFPRQSFILACCRGGISTLQLKIETDVKFFSVDLQHTAGRISTGNGKRRKKRQRGRGEALGAAPHTRQTEQGGIVQRGAAVITCTNGTNQVKEKTDGGWIFFRLFFSTIETPKCIKLKYNNNNPSDTLLR